MSFKDDLYERMGPWAYADADNGYALRTLCYGLAAMFEEVEDLGIATDDLPGWAKALSVQAEDGSPRVPANLLPWLAQFVGVRIPTGTADANARALVKGAEGLTRGSRAAIEDAAQRFLTGAKTVVFKERDGGAYKLTVYVYTQQVTDAAKLDAAVRAQKPAGIVLTLNVISGGTYSNLVATRATYSAVVSAYATYAALREAV